MLKPSLFLLIQLLSLCAIVKGQANDDKSRYRFFVEPEIHFGKVVSNFSSFPKSDFTKSFSLSLGIDDNRKISASQFLNSPSTGLSLLYSDLGNDSVLGHSFHIMPFLMFKPFASKQDKWWLKFGIGAGYYTKTYSNSASNLAIGSKVNWSFQAYLYRDVYLSDKYDIRLGAGYLHSSNGHTKLPNMGLNSAQVSLAYRWKLKPLESKKRYQKTRVLDTIKTKRYLFYNLRTGLGSHEYGGKAKPIGGHNKPVYSLAASVGILFHKHIKVRTGFTYRFYQHYYDRIKDYEDSDLADHLVWNSSNIYFHLGCEFLVGHFGLDVEGGLNLFKPNFKNYYSEFASTDKMKYQLKKHFVSRMGLNFYFINTNKMPKNNFFIGANINANFGQADFSEFSFGYTHTLK